ncbi:hypothetical protein F5Y18DRAFT_370186 [Xylariaceae sp. FL1019]|nr:hypothetical protein F5Y18DRAFT_370186 [Xylariaceae sp. FL1019]
MEDQGWRLVQHAPGSEIEALDQLEDQLEAFGQVAHPESYAVHEQGHLPSRPTFGDDPAKSSPSVRFTTPQPKRNLTRMTPASLRVKPVTEPRKPMLRKSTSMLLDSPKRRAEEKALMQEPLKQTTSRPVASLRLPPATNKSNKQPTLPKFEVPGDAVAQQSKEKKESRPAAASRATQPTAASLRRSKSAKLPTLPAFELPGEAISRRKREEHETKLRMQEDEERKRREFKARPVPSHTMPSTAPRDTITSRARQNKPGLSENESLYATPTKRSTRATSSHARPALLSANNQLNVRGRMAKPEGSPTQASRATSTSTCSISGKRTSVSVQDVQMQKSRGHEIYRRDNSWSDDRLREKHEREIIAKLAREEAAEKSRLQSREWAAKQAQKRRTISSLRDLV